MFFSTNSFLSLVKHRMGWIYLPKVEQGNNKNSKQAEKSDENIIAKICLFSFVLEYNNIVHANTMNMKYHISILRMMLTLHISAIDINKRMNEENINKELSGLKRDVETKLNIYG